MIRIFKVDNDPAYLPVIRKLFSAYSTELGEDLSFQNFNDELDDPFKKYGFPSGALLLAYFNNDPVGCIALQNIDEETCEMKRMYVMPEHRKHGVGESLVEVLLENAKAIGYTKMVLDTLERLQPAIRLYKKYGFEEVTAYYFNPLPGVVYMEKKL